MTREQWKKRLPMIQAFVDGKEVQFLGLSGQFYDSDSPDFITIDDYRIKQEQKFRQWNTEEVPVGALIRLKGSVTVSMIMSNHDNNGRPYFHAWVNRVLCSEAAEKYEWRWANLPDWKPCGIFE